VNAYSYRNAGDAAIMLSTARLLTDLGATSVAVASRYDDSAAYGAFGLDVVPPIIAFPAAGEGSGLARLSVLARGSARAMAAVITRGRLGAHKLRADYDTLVIAGGGYMYSSKRRLNMSLWHSLLSVKYGATALNRVLMMPQSIGPITRRFDQAFVSWALRGVDVVVRETVSLGASRYRPRLTGVRVVDDVAFYPGVTLPPRATPSKPMLRLVAMDWTWSTSVSADRFERYVQQMAVLADLAVDAGFSVVIGGHSLIREHDQDDIRVAEQIQRMARRPVAVDTNADVAHLYDEYLGATVVVGTRLHSCIMALSVGTPAIGLSYQEKTVGVLAGVGHGAYVHSVDDFEPRVVMEQIEVLASTPEEHWTELADRTKRVIFDQYEELAR
jgi:polysaccharide pyruvyl transferase WcaK-like protein